jgi:hypothetical protein
LKVDLLDSVCCLHGTEKSVSENGHEEAFSQIIQMLTKRKDIVSVFTGGCVDTTTLHSATEASGAKATELRIYLNLQKHYPISLSVLE